MESAPLKTVEEIRSERLRDILIEYPLPLSETDHDKLKWKLIIRGYESYQADIIIKDFIKLKEKDYRKGLEEDKFSIWTKLRNFFRIEPRPYK